MECEASLVQSALQKSATFNDQKSTTGTTSMEISLEQQKPPDISARQRANELTKLIRKLRRMGMEEEAERAETALGGVSSADSVLATPPNTD